MVGIEPEGIAVSFSAAPIRVQHVVVQPNGHASNLQSLTSSVSTHTLALGRHGFMRSQMATLTFLGSVALGLLKLTTISASQKETTLRGLHLIGMLAGTDCSSAENASHPLHSRLGQLATAPTFWPNHNIGAFILEAPIVTAARAWKVQEMKQLLAARMSLRRIWKRNSGNRNTITAMTEYLVVLLILQTATTLY